MHSLYEVARKRLALILLAVVSSVPRATAGQDSLTSLRVETVDPDDARWRSGFHRTGFDERVYAFTTYHGDLIATGMFTRAGGTVLDLIARWDGTEWRPLGSGLTGGLNGAALVEFEGRLIVGGHFKKAGDVEAHSIAAWDGTEWHAMGSGFNGFVHALCVYRDTLIAGGTFIEADGAPASGLAFWDGSAWRSLRSGVTGGTKTVSALLVYNGLLAIAGHFDEFAGVRANNIVFWDGEHAQPLGEGLSFATEALAVFGPDLIAGGWFRNAGGRPANGIAAWDGSGWRDIGGVLGGGSPGVTALNVHEGMLYAGGYFNVAGGVPANNVARWDGSSWHALGSGTSGLPDFILLPICHAIHPYGGELYFGGEFLLAGGMYTPAMARWKGDSWLPVSPGQGIPGLVFDIEVQPGHVMVGGGFPWAGNKPNTECMARWNGADWDALDAGVDSTVMAIRAFDGGLVVGGEFLHASGAPANRVARWDGSSWHPMGVGFDARVWDLLAKDGVLYACGDFTRSGAVELNHVAQWDGSSWMPLGPGLDEAVFTLAVHRDTLVAGGNFSFSGSTPVNFIAKWDGVSWRPIGDPGMFVHIIDTFRGDLIAGGRGFGAHGSLARWNGSSWEGLFPLYSNVLEVNALQVLNDRLFAAGQIQRIGRLIDGLRPGNVARWDGITWSTLGSGTNNMVLDLAIQGGSLLVGGGFDVAGGKGSAGFAIWDEIPLPVGIHDLRASRTASGITLTWSSSADAGDIVGIRVQRALAEHGPFEDRTDPPLDPSKATSFIDRNAETGVSYWYRLAVGFRNGGSSVLGPILVDGMRLGAWGADPGLSVVPTSAGMQIRYHLEAGPVPVTLGVFDVRGRLVVGLERAVQPPGDYVRLWDARDGNGRPMPNGLYFVYLATRASRASAKCLVQH